MHSNTQIIAALLLGLCFLGSAGEKSTGENRSEPAKPNIVFIYVDDLGWADVGFNGSTYYETPNIDRLASQGIIFSQAYANAPNCAPSRPP